MVAPDSEFQHGPGIIKHHHRPAKQVYRRVFHSETAKHTFPLGVLHRPKETDVLPLDPPNCSKVSLPTLKQQGILFVGLAPGRYCALVTMTHRGSLHRVETDDVVTIGSE